MLQWILIFLAIAAVASHLGFRGVAGASAGIAKILIFVVLVIFKKALFARIIVVARSELTILERRNRKSQHRLYLYSAPHPTMRGEHRQNRGR
ncbi:MAG: DUF1328 domain-containing protein, partial [Rhizobium sp.]|nr:DUF1328 domain-containing protein [Rhizobium sp.]